MSRFLNLQQKKGYLISVHSEINTIGDLIGNPKSSSVYLSSENQYQKYLKKTFFKHTFRGPI